MSEIQGIADREVAKILKLIINNCYQLSRKLNFPLKMKIGTSSDIEIIAMKKIKEYIPLTKRQDKPVWLIKQHNILKTQMAKLIEY